MRFLRITWNHGHAKAQEYIRERKLLRFVLADSGQVLEGYIVAIHGVHAMIEVKSKQWSPKEALMSTVKPLGTEDFPSDDPKDKPAPQDNPTPAPPQPPAEPKPEPEPYIPVR